MYRTHDHTTHGNTNKAGSHPTEELPEAAAVRLTSACASQPRPSRVHNNVTVKCTQRNSRHINPAVLCSSGGGEAVNIPQYLV
jgi:hypothetical protein